MGHKLPGSHLSLDIFELIDWFFCKVLEKMNNKVRNLLNGYELLSELSFEKVETTNIDKVLLFGWTVRIGMVGEETVMHEERNIGE